MVNRLNSLTKQEMAVLRERQEKRTGLRPILNCAHCEKAFREKKQGQRFCNSKCRSAYGHAVLQLTLERLYREEREWRAERAELVQEIADLRRRLGSV